MSKTPQYIQICLQHKEKPDLKKKMKISLDDQFSVIDEQVFLNKQMEYYYQGQLINKKQTFRQLQITQNDTVIEHQPLQGDQILIKFQHLEQNDIKEFLVQSNELLSEYIYKLIGKKTKDVWVSINNQEIENIEQTFAALKIQNALILYQHLQIKLQVWHNGNASEVIVDRDKCVIDLFYILRNHFQIADQQLIELEYGNQNVQGVLLNQKLWAASQKPYKVVILKQDQLSGKNQSIKLYFINKKQYVDFSLDLDQKIEQFQKEFLFLNSYPKNQPVECYIKHQVDPINKEIQIKTLNIQELQIEVKDLINVGTLNKINKEHNYFEVYFNSMISILYDHLKVNNCNFFFKNKPIKQDLTFQDIEFYDMDTIEYEIIQTSSFVKIIVIENNQQQDIELDNQLTIQDLRQQLNIRSSFDLLLEDDQVVKDDQILRELARDGKLKLNLRQIKKLPTEKRKQQSEIIYYKRNLEDQIHVNELPQNKYQLSVSILGVIHQIEFEENKQVKDLRQVIIEKYKQKDDIVIRYKNNILSSSDPIPYSSEVIFVFPYVINVKIHVSQKKQTFDKKLQPHEKIGDIISKLVQQIKTKSNSVKLIMGNQILDVNKTIKELGIVDGAELNLMI
ncbi:unnamed protein product [Paramecium sonneborni]|uniref:Ubiquitin-like domain-containing protein n=1 Tax=Paramecium sonneborni TaxID=65129 RepID=A0A8S1R7K9_9CILI|nr:unnamed protein product [Paramecium sonneborni]